MDLVTRKWICELVSIEETSTQVQVVFLDALEAEGLLELVEARQDAVPADPFPSMPTLTWPTGAARRQRQRTADDSCSTRRNDDLHWPQRDGVLNPRVH